MLRVAIVAVLLLGCAQKPPPERAQARTSATWRIVSYNIHHGRGMDERVDLERIADVLRRLDPDVVALQEVDERVERSGGVDQAARLGTLLGMSHAFGSFMDYQGGRYGMAILSHCQIRRMESVRLPEGNEPRVALVAEVAALDGGVLTVVDVHFDWVADDGFRFAQAGQVARYLDGLAGRWIVIGDFNDQPGSRTLDLFHTRAAEAAKPRDRRSTFPSDDPRREIDFIFAAPRGAWTVRSVEVVAESVASDHRPVLAVLTARGDAPGAQPGRACPR
jgi:endonuclease/exonuclease/phosphatase family metal-dependent hydrolase